jgi:hypothetical protein
LVIISSTDLAAQEFRRRGEILTAELADRLRTGRHIP